MSDLVTFSQMGFDSTVTACSAEPTTDGYVVTFSGMPYHIHPIETASAYAALEAAISANEVTVNPYVAPVLTLAQAQQMQTEVLYSECQNAIVGGFASSALGSTYTYPSSLTDQANQNAIAQCASGGLLYCQDSTGKWALVSHTQVQAQEVIASFAAWLNRCQSQLATLMAEVNSPSATVESVQAGSWS